MDDLGEGLDGLLDVVERREERLSLLLAFARDEAHALPLRAGVEKVHGAGGALARDLDARHLIAELERQLEGEILRRFARAQAELRLAEPLVAGRQGVNYALTSRTGGAQHTCRELAVRADAGREAEGLVARRVLDGGEHAAGAECLEPVGKRTRIAVVVDAVAEPDNARCAGRSFGQRRLECGEGRLAIRGKRLRLEPAERRACFGRGLEANGARLGGARRVEHDHGPALGLGFGDQALGDRHPLGPSRRAGPAVVDRDDDRARALQRLFLGRVEDGLGERKDDERGGEETDEQQPPGSLGRRLFLVLEADENACRRKFDLLGARRDRPQEPVDEGKRRKRREQPRVQEGEGAKRHGAPPAAVCQR